MSFKIFSISLFLGFIFFFDCAVAQNSSRISGRVLDSTTGEPIAGAQVFLNGTTIGTSSDTDGNFTIEKVPSGVFELVGAFLGYERVTIQINTDTLQEQYIISLIPTVYSLDEVVVTPNRTQWKYNYEVFRKEFIGLGPFSDATKILNPEVLSFDFDVDENKLTASSYERLIIDNDDLGYIIYFYLEFFEIDYSNNTKSFLGLPLFEPKSSNRKRTNNRWAKNREKAYRGSFLHFTKSLLTHSLSEEGFLVRGEKREEDATYVYDEIIPDESLLKQIDTKTYSLSFEYFLNVMYLNEKEDKTYLKVINSPFTKNPRLALSEQISSFTLLEDSISIDASGFIYNPLSLIFAGYWAFEKTSDLLPLDYSIEK